MKLLVSIVGPTAVGKTSFAIRLAKEFGTEILSVDSRQFYREMELGTAKPSKEELKTVKHHFIDSHGIAENINAGQYEKIALELLDKLFQKYAIVIAVGGSGLYFQALWEGMDQIPKLDHSIREQLGQELERNGLDSLLEELKRLDPEYYAIVDQRNPQRVMRALEVIRGTGNAYSTYRRKDKSTNRSFQNLKIGLSMDRDQLYQRINQRMDNMISEGLFEEANRLKSFKDHNALQTVGYTEVFKYLEGHYDRDEAIRLLKRNSRRYAKRQYTWFNRDSEIIWLHPSETTKAEALIRDRLSI